ncbi:hypothetical protein Nepgr_032403 [Nepenthes gracilis]|uniref:Nuclear pore complex protein NUP88 n=1 Tax=Nepenthes gracilis TaxID=150966 RepID=A0AAD3TII1_NEPGR|nr:hypothetical protein Nepgr_032403 [Nepenthes gracilis]
MRFTFDLPEPGEQKEERKSLNPPTPSTDEVEWIPLQNHPVFAHYAEEQSSGEVESATCGRMTRNLLAWDGASRLYFWDSGNQCLHRFSIRFGESSEPSVIAASPSKVLRADKELKFVVNKISINRRGSAIVLAGPNDLCVMYLSRHTSAKDNSIICRTVPVGLNIYLNAIRIVQVTWHPYGDTHVGVLSSDSVLRIFDLSSVFGQPEQEYYLEVMEPGRSRKASSLCPVDFSFGRDHLWDKFSVFILFSDGSVYVLCPVAPFGSVYMWESVMEMYSDAQAFGVKSTNTMAVRNSKLAISWLEDTFPELNRQGIQVGSLSVVEARPFALIDVSLLLQGPLCKVWHQREEDLGVNGPECEGCAVSLLYNSIGKDSILVTAWSGGQLQIDALADEIQPLWYSGSPPRLCVDAHNRILCFAMICESFSGHLPVIRLDQPLDNIDWFGHPPPLLRLAIVDLDFPKNATSDSPVSVYVDPLIPNRIYSLHNGGVDSIVLHFLPFASQTSGKGQITRSPSVHPVLSTSQGIATSPSSLCGFAILGDSNGNSWIVGIASTRECVVLDMKSWYFVLPTLTDMEKNPTSFEEPIDGDMPNIISKELLSGPKVVIVPQASPNFRSPAAESIEGRSILHQYFKLFHENYVEYAHKVYLELQHHGPHVKKIIDKMHARLCEAQQKLLNVKEKQPKLDERIQRALQVDNILEERLQRLTRLPGIRNMPLTRAERKFKSELDMFRTVELDALHSSIEALNSRLQRYTLSPSQNVSTHRWIPSSKPGYVQDTLLDQIKATLQKLSLVNSENSKKVQLLESSLKSLEVDSR